MSTASLLIVLGEPHYDTQIRPILDRILEGELSFVIDFSFFF